MYIQRHGGERASQSHGTGFAQNNTTSGVSISCAPRARSDCLKPFGLLFLSRFQLRIVRDKKVPIQQNSIY